MMYGKTKSSTDGILSPFAGFYVASCLLLLVFYMHGIVNVFRKDQNLSCIVQDMFLTI